MVSIPSTKPNSTASWPTHTWPLNNVESGAFNLSPRAFLTWFLKFIWRAFKSFCLMALSSSFWGLKGSLQSLLSPAVWVRRSMPKNIWIICDYQIHNHYLFRYINSPIPNFNRRSTIFYVNIHCFFLDWKIEIDQPFVDLAGHQNASNSIIKIIVTPNFIN